MSSITLKSVHLIIMRSYIYIVIYYIVRNIHVKMNFIVINP